MSVTHAPTAFEQLFLEYTNRARLNPENEFDALIADVGSVTGVQGNITSAIRYFGVDLEALRVQFDALDATAPLAWNSALADAAEGHTQQMISFDTQSHQLPGEASLGDRIRDAGYSFSRAGENVFAYTQDPLHGHAGFFIDWGFDDADQGANGLLSNWQSIGDGIQDAAGHRVSIMNSRFTEVGMSAVDDSADDATDQVGPYAVTQNFGSRWDYVPQLLGVVIDDADGDAFYDIGEGLGGLSVTATSDTGTFETTTWASGGYQMVLPGGVYDVTVSGDALDGVISFSVTMGSENLKRDAFAADAQPEGPMRETGSVQNDMLSGAAGDDVLRGADGADTLTGGAGDDVLYGDVVPISSLGDVAGQVYRLYQATLDRAPDAAGFQDWAERLFEGTHDLEQLAEGFVASQEFQSVYGALSDTDFVDLLYQNVLERAGSVDEISAWVNQLVGSLVPSEVVLRFSESSEFVSGSRRDAAQAAEAASAPAWQDDVFRLYQATLDRAPDADGFLGWAAQLAGGQTYLDAVAGFVGSAEFQATYGTLPDGEFVDLLYQNVLGRGADDAGRQGWLDVLADGGTRAEVVRGFAQSDEFRSATAEPLKAWIRDQGVQDVLDGGAGHNMLSGGAMSDRFVFSPEQGGTHEVVDLEAWDYLDFAAFGYDTAAQVRARIAQDGDDLVFADQGVSVVLHNTVLTDVTDDMILI
ncbi:DUF4214 domain-containing protein [Sulfitobacter sp. S190]|uniref:DUF4214 domain-containing protein n=1 Tax=Sulfitobacter sp. S190 TaxID=2867022 RepID=UPI0021A5F3A1|nr:DUF4214 domain-containing protein [Sulfitobacter sp. S190]UWR24446.1 DUF4214 domain-containing protein [Sulfitobacter sp. S190]